MTSRNEIIQLKGVQIEKNLKLSDNLYLLSFIREFDFIPGQIIGITIDKNIEPRLYSIASGIKDNHVNILYDIKDEGQLTPKLSELQNGNKIFVSNPFGKFICSDDEAYWIAAGTGIAPFISMFKSGLGQGKTIIHGAREIKSFYCSNELISFFREKYIRCSSKENDPNVYSGRLTSYLENLQKLPQHQKYYLCGSSEMVVETRDILISKGIPFYNIISEIYF